MNKVSDLHPEELAALLHLPLGEARAWFETAELLASGAVLDSWMNWFRLSPKMHLLLPSIRHLMRVSVEELEWLGGYIHGIRTGVHTQLRSPTMLLVLFTA